MGRLGGARLMIDSPISLGSIEMDRAIGVVLGGAVGDALGAGYEFTAAPEPEDVVMRPGTLTGMPAGCWTDDTAMAIAVLEIAASHGTLITNEALISVGERFLDWFRSGPKDIGIQTRTVLGAATSGADLGDVAAKVQVKQRDRAGNGSLMRTGPVALAHLGDDDALARAAMSISALTHPNPFATDACVLWTIAIDRAVRTAELEGPSAGLHLIDASRRSKWKRWIAEAETLPPGTFRPNGFVVVAFQAAWSAIHSTMARENPFVDGLRQAVAIGDDTDTVASIAGSLLGAAMGVEAIPLDWRQGLAGWPDGYRDIDLKMLAVRATLRSGDVGQE